MPGEFGAGDAVENALDQAIAERGQVRRVRSQIPTRNAHGLSKPDDARDVFGPGAAVALMTAPVQLRLEPDAGAHDQAADAFRTVELVRLHGQQVDAQLVDAHRDLPRRLHGVAVEVGVTARPRHRDQFTYWFDGSDLIVRVHDAHQDGVGPQRLAQRRRIDQAKPVDAQSGDLESVALQRLGGAK